MKANSFCNLTLSLMTYLPFTLVIVIKVLHVANLPLHSLYVHLRIYDCFHFLMFCILFVSFLFMFVVVTGIYSQNMKLNEILLVDREMWIWDCGR